jgi:site-specific recombinase XerD
VKKSSSENGRGTANIDHFKKLLGRAILDTLKHYTRLTIDDLKMTHEKCHPRERGED